MKKMIITLMFAAFSISAFADRKEYCQKVKELNTQEMFRLIDLAAENESSTVASDQIMAEASKLHLVVSGLKKYCGKDYPNK